MQNSEGQSPVACAETRAPNRIGGEQGPRAVFLIRLAVSSRALAFLLRTRGGKVSR